MSGFSTSLADAILNWLKGTNMAAAPASVYVALYDGDPGDDGTGGTDVTATINAAGRVAVTFGTVSAKSMSNSAEVDFGDADAGASVTHIGLWDASSGGNFLAGNALVTPRTITTGDPVRFPVGDLTVGLPAS